MHEHTKAKSAAAAFRALARVAILGDLPHTIVFLHSSRAATDDVTLQSMIVIITD